jgi:hypothetical protein
MTKSIVLTAADTDAHNLYALILAALGVTQLPQRVDLGAVFFPDFVASVNFFLPSATAGQYISIQDQNGNEMVQIGPNNPTSLGAGIINNISLQALKIQASVTGIVTEVTVFQI